MDDLGDEGLPNPNDVNTLADLLTDHLPLDKLRLHMKLQLMRISSKGNTLRRQKRQDTGGRGEWYMPRKGRLLPL